MARHADSIGTRPARRSRRLHTSSSTRLQTPQPGAPRALEGLHLPARSLQDVEQLLIKRHRADGFADRQELHADLGRPLRGGGLSGMVASSDSVIVVRRQNSHPLALQLMIMLREKRTNVLRDVEQLHPLFLIESHREATQSIDRQRPLRTHLEMKAAGLPAFQGVVA